MTKRRLRKYCLFHDHRGKITNRQPKMGKDMIPWYFVRAVSIQQAYYMAGNRQFAETPKEAGCYAIHLRRWWHDNEFPQVGKDILLAEYLDVEEDKGQYI